MKSPQQNGPHEASFTEDERYRLLVEAVTDYAIYMLDLGGFVTSWNGGAQRIKGYKEGEILGQHFSRFYTEEDRNAGLPAKALATAAAEGRFEGEGWRIRKDGARFWASVIIDAIHDSSGKLRGFAKITRDITERRDSQLALEKAREALVQSQKMEALGQLTGGIAHDFNNLLTVILGSLEIARKRIDENDPVTRLIDNAISGAQRGAALTQRMLAFARHQDLKLEAVDIPTLIRGMTELLERTLGPSVMIETRFPLNLQWVTADPNQLEMAVLNLAVNARDAMPEGGPLILAARAETISSASLSGLKAGTYVCLSVTDRGVGMDEDTLSKAIDPFFTTKEIGKGTGLGLSMAHGVAQQAGGRMVLKSRPGEGTTAELWLPVAPKMAQVAEVETAKDAAEPRRPLTLLVVDDDHLVLTNMVAMLEDLGHKVFAARGGQEALATLRRESAIDLVITDQAMPQMKGTQLIAAINAEWPDLPTILATGYAELPAGIAAMQPRLSKPFLQYDLIQAVNDAMLQHKERRVLKFRSR